jgi:hypothetical protein
MHIEGYVGTPVFDARGWLADELFWPAFLLHVGSAVTAPAAFDVDPADLEAHLDRFEDPGRWPVFTVPIGAGTMFLIVCNMPDDPGIDWVLDEDAMAALRRDETPPTGPGLPWSLLPPDPAQLLIALQAAGDDPGALEASDRVCAALRAVGAVDRVTELADDLLEHRAWILR